MANETDSLDIKKVSSHHWLRHPGDVSFHSYLIAKPGTHSVCGSGRPLSSLNLMDIPGEPSPCCNACFRGLYGVDLRAVVVE